MRMLQREVTPTQRCPFILIVYACRIIKKLITNKVQLNNQGGNQETQGGINHNHIILTDDSL